MGSESFENYSTKVRSIEFVATNSARVETALRSCSIH